MTVEVTIRYFASLRDRAGISDEQVRTGATDLAALYAERDGSLGLDWPREHLRVSVNGAFADWSRAPATGDEIVFIPPVSGG